MICLVVLVLFSLSAINAHPWAGHGSVFVDPGNVEYPTVPAIDDGSDNVEFLDDSIVVEPRSSVQLVRKAPIQYSIPYVARSQPVYQRRVSAAHHSSRTVHQHAAYGQYSVPIVRQHIPVVKHSYSSVQPC